MKSYGLLESDDIIKENDEYCYTNEYDEIVWVKVPSSATNLPKISNYDDFDCIRREVTRFLPKEKNDDCPYYSDKHNCLNEEGHECFIDGHIIGFSLKCIIKETK